MKLIRALSRTFSRAPPPAMMMDLSAYPADDDEDVASKRSVYDPHFMPPEGWDAWSEWAAEQGKIARIVNTLAKSIMSFLIKSHDKDCQDLCDVMTRSTHLHTASMEPCLFRHGKDRYCKFFTMINNASMEPCLFRHGKSASSMRARTSSTCFNGAMSFQTW